MIGRWVMDRPDAKGLGPVVLSDGTVTRVKHRALVYVRSTKDGFGSLLETTGHWGLSVRSLVLERPVS